MEVKRKKSCSCFPSFKTQKKVMKTDKSTSTELISGLDSGKRNMQNAEFNQKFFKSNSLTLTKKIQTPYKQKSNICIPAFNFYYSNNFPSVSSLLDMSKNAGCLSEQRYSQRSSSITGMNFKKNWNCAFMDSGENSASDFTERQESELTSRLSHKFSNGTNKRLLERYATNKLQGDFQAAQENLQNKYTITSLNATIIKEPLSKDSISSSSQFEISKINPLCTLEKSDPSLLNTIQKISEESDLFIRVSAPIHLKYGNKEKLPILKPVTPHFFQKRKSIPLFK